MDLGVPAHLKGYQYLTEAVLLHISDEKLAFVDTLKSLANLFGTTKINLRKMMNDAVKVAWDRGAMHTYLGDTIDQKCPTEAEFVLLIAEKIRQE